MKRLIPAEFDEKHLSTDMVFCILTNIERCNFVSNGDTGDMWVGFYRRRKFAITADRNQLKIELDWYGQEDLKSWFVDEEVLKANGVTAQVVGFDSKLWIISYFYEVE